MHQKQILTDKYVILVPHRNIKNELIKDNINRNKLFVGTILIKNGTISMKVGTIAVR